MQWTSIPRRTFFFLHGHRYSRVPAEKIQWGCRRGDLNSQPLGYKLSALAIELYSPKDNAGKWFSLSRWCVYILDNIEKTRKKAGMIFSSDFDRRKTKPLKIYIKFWKQACLPCLLFGAELFSLNKSQLCQLERCQQWFLKNVFYVPKFAPGHLLLKISNLNSIESEIDLKNSCFWVV